MPLLQEERPPGQGVPKTEQANSVTKDSPEHDQLSEYSVKEQAVPNLYGYPLLMEMDTGSLWLGRIRSRTSWMGN